MTSIAFTGSRLDRADHVRSDPVALRALMGPGARLLRMDGLLPDLQAGGELAWGSLAEASDSAELIFLGLLDGAGCFAAVESGFGGDDGPAAPAIWRMLTALPSDELATYGTARALVSWHARHRFCARCGGATVMAKGGWQRTCTACSGEHFPRTDPVTIMLVEHDGNLLLGRQPRFPVGNYSALAGFVEPGESLEEAVAREVLEEAGVRVRDVTYVASQPWPFPSSLMIGCHSHADEAAITIDTTELDDARWFSRAEVADAIEASGRGEKGQAFGAPPSFAIAHHLMRWWLERVA